MSSENLHAPRERLTRATLSHHHAIESLFKVRVEKVRTSRQLGKVRRVGRHMGRRPDWKKAYVTLAEGSRIDFFEGA